MKSRLARRGLLVSSLLAAFLASAAGAAEGERPFKVPPGSFRDSVRTIALAPVTAQAVDASVAELMEARVVESLASAGFRVVPSEGFDQVWRQLSECVGGAYDPVTGKRRDERWSAVYQHTMRELGRQYRADAVAHLYVSIEPKQLWARMGKFTAFERPVLWRGEPFPLILPGDLDSATWIEKLMVSYFNVVIENLLGVRLYQAKGGIGVTRVYALGSYEETPPEALYQDTEIVQQAIEAALGPLARTRPPAASEAATSAGHR